MYVYEHVCSVYVYVLYILHILSQCILHVVCMYTTPHVWSVSLWPFYSIESRNWLILWRLFSLQMWMNVRTMTTIAAKPALTHLALLSAVVWLAIPCKEMVWCVQVSTCTRAGPHVWFSVCVCLCTFIARLRLINPIFSIRTSCLQTLMNAGQVDTTAAKPASTHLALLSAAADLVILWTSTTQHAQVSAGMYYW